MVLLEEIVVVVAVIGVEVIIVVVIYAVDWLARFSSLSALSIDYSHLILSV